MNFKIIAATLGVIAALSVPVVVAARSSGPADRTQGDGAGTCAAAGDCTQDQLRLRDGSCGGSGDGTREQQCTQTCAQTRACLQEQAGVAAAVQAGDGAGTCTAAGDCTQDQLRLRDGSCGGSGDGTQDQVRTRDCGQTCSGDQDQTRTRQHLGSGK